MCLCIIYCVYSSGQDFPTSVSEKLTNKVVYELGKLLHGIHV